jgi:hypothetical protein
MARCNVGMVVHGGQDECSGRTCAFEAVTSGVSYSPSASASPIVRLLFLASHLLLRYNTNIFKLSGMYLYTSIQVILLGGGALTSAAILPRQTNGTGYAIQTPPLDTDWTYNVGTNPWPEYPRPQMERSQWKNLNGIWRYQNASGTDAVDNPPFGETLEREVLVPSCLESGLSGERYSRISITD